MDGHLLKLKCKYSNILRYLFFTFINCKLQSSKLTHKKRLKCFHFHVMNLKYEKNDIFHHILVFLDVPVCKSDQEIGRICNAEALSESQNIGKKGNPTYRPAKTKVLQKQVLVKKLYT